MNEIEFKELKKEVAELKQQLAQKNRILPRWLIKALEKKAIRYTFLAALVLIPLIIYAASLTKQYNFTAGTKASSFQVNTNFDALYTESNAQDGRITALENSVSTIQSDVTNLSTCPSDMAAVGDFCVDKYEASVWSSSTGGTPYGGAGTTCGSDITDYPCNKNGNNCTNIYARSIPGVTPSRCITWFQAAQACANSGKHLITNMEWQIAATGSPDPDADVVNQNVDPAITCNVDSVGIVNTGNSSGGGTPCISRWGTYDMVGNVWELVDMWNSAPLVGNAFDWTGTFSDDGYWGNSVLQVSAALRGGFWLDGPAAGVFALFLSNAPSDVGFSIGFRCARSK